MRIFLFILIILAGARTSSAQNFRKLNREGVSSYKNNSFDKAELSFLKAREIDSASLEANYNIANTLYKQDKFDEASGIFQELTSSTDHKNTQADIFHNLGNSLLQKEQYEQSIEAYKNALRIRPEDNETRYNLAFAQAKLREQQQQQQQQNDQDQNQEQEDQENNQDNQEKKNQQDQDQQQENQEQQNQQQPEESGNQEKEAMQALSKEDMERLLQAIQQQERMVQEKLEKEKAKAAKIRTEKDW